MGFQTDMNEIHIKLQIIVEGCNTLKGSNNIYYIFDNVISAKISAL